MIADQLQRVATVKTSTQNIFTVISNKIQVTSEAEETRARTVFSELRAEAKKNEKEYDKFLKPLKEGVKTLQNACKESVAPLYQAADLINKRVGDYRAELNRKQQELEQQARAAAEQQNKLEAFKLAQQASETMVVEKIKGAGLKEEIEIEIANYASVLHDLYNDIMAFELTNQKKYLPNTLLKALTAWAKAEAKKGRRVNGVTIKQVTKLQNR